jgi:hypothetical protein
MEARAEALYAARSGDRTPLRRYAFRPAGQVFEAGILLVDAEVRP